MASAKGSILITGSNGGLGASTVQQILSRPELAKDYHGIYTVRKVETADAVKRVLQKAAAAQHRYELLPLDLSSLASVRKAAEDINRRVASGEVPPIRALILNAGWQEQYTQTWTGDGFDASFQNNYLSHFLLTHLLLPSMEKENGRIVVVGSWTHDTADPRVKIGPYAAMYDPEKYRQIFNDPRDIEPLAKGRWSTNEEFPEDPNPGMRRYGAAKLAEVMMMRELSYRLPKVPTLSNISALAVDPGGMSSDLGQRSSWVVRVILGRFVAPMLAPLLTWLQPNGVMRTTWKSGGDLLRAAFDTQELGQHPNGLYLNGSELGDVGAEAKDTQKTGNLWRESLEYAGIRGGESLLAQ